MNNDQELLELAAKALSLKCAGELLSGGLMIERGDGLTYDWDPLDDDADALRLAVKLKIDIEFYLENPLEGEGVAASYYSFVKPIYCRESTSLNPDLFAATRRAIVRAAAEIGRKV